MELKDLKPGYHICWIYKDEEEFNSLIVPLILTGLKNNEKVVYINREEEINRLKELSKDIKPYLERGDLSLFLPEEFYSSSKVFDFDKFLQEYSSLRVIGDASTILKDVSLDSILTYEATINSLPYRDKTLLICLYDKRKISTDILLQALQTHPLVLIGGKVYSNFYYIPPKELLTDRTEATFNNWTMHLEDRVRLEEDLEKLQNFYKAIFENTGTSTIVVEEDTIISLVNRTFEGMFGFKKEEIEGKRSWQEFVYNIEDLERMREYHRLRRINPELAPKMYETRLKDKYGNIKDVWLTVDIIPGTTKSIVSILDITELKRTNRLLKMLSEVNQVLVRAKDRDELLRRTLEVIKTTGDYKNISIDTKEADILKVYREEGLDSSELRILDELSEDIKYGLSTLETKKRYEILWRNAPIALLEEDFSELIEYLNNLRSLGIEDLELYLDEHPEEIETCTHKIKVIDINNAGLELFKAKNIEEIRNLNKIIPKEGFKNFKREIIDISKGLQSGEFRSINYNLLGERMYIYLRWFIIPEYRENLSRGIVAIIDITERVLLEEELRKLVNDLKRAFEETINTLSSIIEIRDLYTSGHQKRVAELSSKIGERMGLDDDSIRLLRIAGLLHDIGKISVPGDILNKPGKLSPLEFEMVKTHPSLGYEILKNISYFPELAKIVLQHHERLDGSGYPQGLKDGEILLAARILAVADVVEAMTSHRPYRPAYNLEEALEEIKKNRYKLYDPDVVDACVELFKEGFRFSG
jgi:PAS domain S-box-containing protein/putative nucleotidyltransferase with HDIG domain